ncbi:MULTISPECIES: MarR family winged helix-turn-helix transcriptional regulator [unclassified Curtobacterium]|uniref:MarR family winged helix-turn-helix transcriptional regulator n=1 Tax=unclassified Curtobacterium TaxID=257496 RepID=UPI00381BDA16
MVILNEQTYGESGYWYPDRASRSGIQLLNLMRQYRSAEVEMRQRTRKSMRMNQTDMEAVRYLLRAGERGKQVNSSELAAHLGITSASTTAVVRRLVSSGHVERHADPSDGRGVLLTATGHTDEEVRTTLTDVHARMIAAAERLSPQTVEEMSGFFTDMIDAMHADDTNAELRADDARPMATPAPHAGR